MSELSMNYILSAFGLWIVIGGCLTALIFVLVAGVEHFRNR